MSPGIQTITQLDLPMTIEHPDCKCPVCGKKLVIQKIKRWDSDGQVGLNGIELTCASEPNSRGERWNQWHEYHWRDAGVWVRVEVWVYQWFNQWLRYRPVEPEVLVRKRRMKRRMKWRRMA